ncbi:MAG TPA: 16S rRNA (guanine(527)-N(7))-methyltransferase RsmG [Steroidobacteraceae bacterium]
MSSGEERRLIEAADALGARLSSSQAVFALRLLDELDTWNRTYSLTAISGRQAMITAHLLDSLSALGELSGSRIADVGTGAGFPGLPLALVSPQRQFTLIDSVAKKIRFVTHAARVLALSNVTALQTRVEALTPAEPFDTVLARAFASLPDLLRAVQGLCGASTRVLAFKGRYPHDELAELPPGWRLERSLPITIPGLNAERHLLRLVPQVA